MTSARRPTTPLFALASGCTSAGRGSAASSLVLSRKTSESKSRRHQGTALTRAGRSCRSGCSPNTLPLRTQIRTHGSLFCLFRPARSFQLGTRIFKPQSPFPFTFRGIPICSYPERYARCHWDRLLVAKWFHCTTEVVSRSGRLSVYDARSSAGCRWHRQTLAPNHLRNL